MSQPAPPLYEALAVPEERQQRPFPKLVMAVRWVQYFSGLVTQINTAASRLVHVRLVLQQATIPTTGLPLGTIVAGVYRVSYRARVTQAASNSSSFTVTISWTEGGVAQSRVAAAFAGNSVTTYDFATIVLRADANTPVSYATTYQSNGATSMQHDLDLVAESLALDS